MNINKTLHKTQMYPSLWKTARGMEHCGNNSYREHGWAGGILTESGDTVQVERGDCLVLGLHKVEGLKGKACFFGYTI